MGAPWKEPLARFLVQAILVIGLSRATGFLTRRLRQPMIVAEIIAGVALGPSVLGALWPRASAAIFPESSLPFLDAWSQIALLLFLFLVGLELDPRLVKGDIEGLSTKAILARHAGIAVPLAAGALLSIYLYSNFAPSGVGRAPFALFLGVALAASAFPVLARLLVERRLLRTRIGAVSIACAAVDGVVAWSGLAIVIALSSGAGLAGAAGKLAYAGLYVAAMLVIVRPILRKQASRTGVKEGVSQHVVAAMLLGMLASAWATWAIGAHPVFGAFAFGVLVPKEGGLSRALAERIEDVVVLLFLPLFFLRIGLRTDVASIAKASAWGTFAIVAIVALGARAAGGLVAARASDLSWRQARTVSVLASTRGLMALAIFALGLDAGVIGPALFTMLVLMALLSTVLVTPVLGRVLPAEEAEKAERAADPSLTSIAPPDAPAGPASVHPASIHPASLHPASIRPTSMRPRPKDAYTVLACVAFDRSGPGMATLASALLGESAHNRFYALRLVPPTERASFVLDQHQAPEDAAALAPLMARAAELKLSARPLSFVSAQPAEDICNVAEVKQASLVLLGWHKPLLGTAVLSGTVHEVMRSAGSDVGVFVDRGLGRVEKILVPYLGSAHDRAALAVARRIVDHTGATAVVLHVVPPTPRNERLGVGEKVEEVFQEKTQGLSAQVVFRVIEHASPVTAVVEEAADDYDLVVIGVGAEWGLSHRPFGMQAEVLIAQSTTSLLILRQGNAAARRAAERAAEEAATALAEVAERT